MLRTMSFPFDEPEIIHTLRNEPMLRNRPSSTEDELITKRHYATHLASCLMIMRSFGQDWCNARITLLSPPDDYFQVNHNDNESHNLFCVRVLAFADLLYNLHNVENFDECVEAIKSNPKGLESGLAELGGGRFFRTVSLPFAYVKRKNKKTLDYDIEYVRPEGRVGICEVKCKVQSTVLNQRSIYTSLAASSKQVPKNSGAVTLLMVPENWLVDMKTSNPTIEAGVNEFFRRSRTSRISEVILCGTLLVPTKKATAHYGVYRRFPNPHCLDTSGIPPIPSNQVVPSSNWKSIVDAVIKAYPRLGS
jgi:hypothetical protein